MAAVTLTLVGFFAFLIIRMTTPQMVPLFTDLSVEDSSSIVKALERQGLAYQIKNDGTIILVAKDNVAKLRMKLAESGLPKGGGVGYEIFDKSEALGSTTFVQNINHLRALEARSGASTACRGHACISCCRNGRCSRAKRSRPRPRPCSRCAAPSSRSRCVPSVI
jgi:secretory protein of YscJ/FliF family